MDSLDQNNLAKVLADLATDVPLADAMLNGAQLFGAPRFSAFELFGPGELELTRIIAELLNPKGLHGQGPLFLNALFKLLSFPAVGWRCPSSEHLALMAA